LAGIVSASLGTIAVPVRVTLNTVSRLVDIAEFVDLSIADAGVLQPAALIV
jgi:uncharacterized protein YpmS